MKWKWHSGVLTTLAKTKYTIDVRLCRLSSTLYCTRYTLIFVFFFFSYSITQRIKQKKIFSFLSDFIWLRWRMHMNAIYPFIECVCVCPRE